MQHMYSMQHATYMQHTTYMQNIQHTCTEHTPYTMQQSRRCATVRNATHVVVLKHGEVVEAGTSLVPIVARAPCD